MGRDKSKSFQWGSANRSKVSNKLGIPTRFEGSDGDIQIRQTNLGTKLFGKVGGRWSSTFLSSEDEVLGTGGTSIGMDSTGAFSVNKIKLAGKIILSSHGTQNICIGTGNVDLGNDNVSIGVDSGAALTSSSSNNILIGTEAGKVMTTATKNICIGKEAGVAITTSAATENCFIGEEAGLICTEGIKNICIGAAAGANITTGEENVMIGRAAGATGDSNNLTSNYNVVLGSIATVPNGSTVDSIVIGRGCNGKGSYTSTIGGSSIVNYYFNENIAAGTSGSNVIMHQGLTNIYPGHDAGQDSAVYLWQIYDKDGDNVISGSDWNRSVWRLACDNSSGSGDEPDFFIHDDIDNATRFTIKQTDGVTYVVGGSVSDIASDKRVKKNIVDIDDGLEIVNKLRPVSYQYNDKSEFYEDDGTLYKGFIADEVKEVAPFYTSEGEGLIDDVEVNDFKSLSTGRMIPMLVKAIQELSAKMDTMQIEINNLK